MFGKVDTLETYQLTEESVGLRGFSRPRCTNGWADGMGVGNHVLGNFLSKMWSTPTDLRRFFRFRGIMGISHVEISQEVGVFAHVVILE